MRKFFYEIKIYVYVAKRITKFATKLVAFATIKRADTFRRVFLIKIVKKRIP